MQNLFVKYELLNNPNKLELLKFCIKKDSDLLLSDIYGREYIWILIKRYVDAKNYLGADILLEELDVIFFNNSYGHEKSDKLSVLYKKKNLKTYSEDDENIFCLFDDCSYSHYTNPFSDFKEGLSFIFMNLDYVVHSFNKNESLRSHTTKHFLNAYFHLKKWNGADFMVSEETFNNFQLQLKELIGNNNFETYNIETEHLLIDNIFDQPLAYSIFKEENFNKKESFGLLFEYFQNVDHIKALDIQYLSIQFPEHCQINIDHFFIIVNQIFLKEYSQFKEILYKYNVENHLSINDTNSYGNNAFFNCLKMIEVSHHFDRDDYNHDNDLDLNTVIMDFYELGANFTHKNKNGDNLGHIIYSRKEVISVDTFLLLFTLNVDLTCENENKVSVFSIIKSKNNVLDYRIMRLIEHKKIEENKLILSACVNIPKETIKKRL